LSELELVIGQSTVSLQPVATGSAHFAVSPALVAGLSLDASTGAITGTPTAEADAVKYTVTAAGPGGDARFSFVLTALPGWLVDVTQDGSDDDSGADAVCHSTAGGGCTLRAALQTANTRSTPQLILLGAATYTLTSALDGVTNDVVLAGQGAGLTHVQPSMVHPGYGALSLDTAHTLTVRKCSIDNFGQRNGGAISATAGTVLVDSASFSNNVAAGSGGAFFFSSGAQATVTRSTFVGNQAFGGCCGGWGGVVDGEGAGTTLVFSQCAATGNSTAWGAFSHITTGTTLQLENSTLYGNTSVTAGTLASPGGTYTLINDTIVHNTNTSSTPDSAGLYLFAVPAHYTLANTIVAYNTDATGAEHNCNRRDLGTSLTSNGGNVFSDSAENCAMYFTAPGDRLLTDPGLVALGPADAGDPSTTLFVPAAGSEAVGIASQCPSVDQRGDPRPTDAGCDVGAVQVTTVDAGAPAPAPRALLGVRSGCTATPHLGLAWGLAAIGWRLRARRRRTG
jgi:CSLREA domain-containing protein